MIGIFLGEKKYSEFECVWLWLVYDLRLFEVSGIPELSVTESRAIMSR